MTEKKRPSRAKRGGGSVGMPAYLLLQQFGALVEAAFGTQCYQVGSSIHSKRWRDVDVRLMLPDHVYEEMFGKPSDAFRSERWISLCLAYSALGRQMTGLPIDFQIQQVSEANRMYGEGHSRNCLGMVPHRYVDYKPYVLEWSKPK